MAEPSNLLPVKQPVFKDWRVTILHEKQVRENVVKATSAFAAIGKELHEFSMDTGINLNEIAEVKAVKA